MTENSSLLTKLENFWESVIQLSEDGRETQKLNLLLQTLDVDYMMFHRSHKRTKKYLVRNYAIVEFLHKNRLMTYIDKLKNARKNTLITQLLKILEALLIGKEKDLLPFWTEHSKEISKKLLLPTKTDCVDLDMNCYPTSLKNMASNSWFSMMKQKVPKKDSLITSSQLSRSFQTDTMVKENIVLRSRKIRLYLNPNQKKIFKQWIGTARYLYNQTIDVINGKDMKYNKSKITKRLVTNNKYDWELNTPRGIREGAVHDACNAYETNMKKYNKTNVPFTLKHRTKKAMSQTIILPVDSITKNFELFPTFLGNDSVLPMKKCERKHIRWKDKYVEKGKKKRLEMEEEMRKKGIDVPEAEIKKTLVSKVLENVLRIQYTRPGYWYLCVPIKKEVKPSDNQGGIISLDPGVRTFLTGYSPDGDIIKIGDNDMNKMRNYLLKTDKFISEISKMKGKKKYRCQKAKLKRFKQVKDWIRDCHRKTVKYLLDNFNYVILPPFGVQKMCNKSTRKINSKTVRNMLCWSHYKFRMMLIDKSNEYDNKYIFCPTEEFTSQTCGRCGNRDRFLGGKKMYSCANCELEIDRDINGSRNILIKFLT